MKSYYDRLVEFIERMLAPRRQLAAAKLEHEQTALKRQIAATDRHTDHSFLLAKKSDV